MGVETYPKQGRTRQHFGGDHGMVLSVGDKVGGKVKAPSSQDCCTKKKSVMWSAPPKSARKC